jgi:hypothetical protein
MINYCYLCLGMQLFISIDVDRDIIGIKLYSRLLIIDDTS